MRLLLTLIAALAVPLATSAPAAAQQAAQATAPALAPALDTVLADPRRAEDRARDPWRHPAETLSFFRVTPDMKVAEFAPGGGWYARVLAPYLSHDGKFVGLFFDMKFIGDKAKAQAAIAGFPQDVAGWTGLPADRFAGYSLDALPESEKGTYDRILVMRMIHNMHRMDMLRGALASFHGLLKPDGLIGVEQHRARPGAPYPYTDGSMGYMREKDVIALFEASGFELVARSEINANPRDTADYPDGVWTLPPTFELKDKDRARYQGIGESDRMTLLFRKRR
jgi:predicted methyltransferase